MDCLQYSSSSDEEIDETNGITTHVIANSTTGDAKSRATTKSSKSPMNVFPIKRMANTNPAPQPSTLATLQLSTNFNNNSNSLTLTTTNNQQLMTNPRKSQLLQPIQGPNLAEEGSSQFTTRKKPTLARGEIAIDIKQNTAFDHTTFEMQRNSFQRSGVALGPSDANGVTVQRTSYGHKRMKFNKETEKYEEVKVQDDRFDTDGTDRSDGNYNENENSQNKKSANKRKRNEAQNDPLVIDSDDEVNYGIWGPPTEEMKQVQNDTLSTLDKVGGVITSLPLEIQKEREHLKERDRQRGITVEGRAEMDSRENQNFDKLVERKMSHLLPPRINGEEAKPTEPTTKLHLSAEEEYNYKNESWIVPPTELRNGADIGDVDHHTCYVPKKCTARFLGHTKGVHRIRLFPRTGHLLLSGGLDGKCKVWNILTKKVCRTYIGHSAAVRDVQFNNNGTKFLSCSFDRFIRLWDTQSGAVLGTYTNRRVPYVIKFYPLDDNTFVVGCSDNKIVAYNSTTGEITQEYNHHLAPVNTITFVEDHGSKMITSSDDKKILVWEWDIGVPIKYISDPTMHSIPVITLHPTGGFFAGQSLDNQIVVYQGKDRFALQRKKKFSGHLVSGYACDIAFSPDGQFICSGDGNGKLFFWDWRRSR